MVRKPSYRHRHSRNCRPGLAHATQKARKDRAKRGPFVDRAFRRFSTTSGVVIGGPDLGGKKKHERKAAIIRITACVRWSEARPLKYWVLVWLRANGCNLNFYCVTTYVNTASANRMNAMKYNKTIIKERLATANQLCDVTTD